MRPEDGRGEAGGAAGGAGRPGGRRVQAPTGVRSAVPSSTEGGIGDRKPAFWARQPHLVAVRSKKSPPQRHQFTTMLHPKLASGRPRKEDRPVKAVATTLDRALIPLCRRALGDSAVRWALLAVAGWAAAVSVLLVWSKAQRRPAM